MGYIYAEIRFAPLLHLEKGMSQLDAAKAALDGVEEAATYMDASVRGKLEGLTEKGT